MLYLRARVFWTLSLVTVLIRPASSQSVISTHSGTVHYFEGTVYLGDQPLELHPGRFSNLPQGGELRTEDGRAEVLLTPGVFIRIGERSTLRMLATELSDTRVELLKGSAIIDSAEPVTGTSVTVLYKNWSVRFLEQGVYRVDSNPPRMWVLDGKAEVSGNGTNGLVVKQGVSVPFAAVLAPDRAISPPIDALSTWSDGRQQSISTDNAIAANIQDPGSMDSSPAGTAGLTYFPPLYLPSAGLSGSSLYGFQGPYQPGFNSIYLPGYNYMPLVFGLRPIGFPPVRQPRYGVGHFPTRPPVRIPMPAGSMSVLPGRGLTVPVHPISPPPSAIHSAPPTGAHIGGHR